MSKFTIVIHFYKFIYSIKCKHNYIFLKSQKSLKRKKYTGCLTFKHSNLDFKAVHLSFFFTLYFFKYMLNSKIPRIPTEVYWWNNFWLCPILVTLSLYLMDVLMIFFISFSFVICFTVFINWNLIIYTENYRFFSFYCLGYVKRMNEFMLNI